MTHTLLVVGAVDPGARPLSRHQVGPRDEVLCGGCDALIAVGSFGWQPGGASLPGTAGATIWCRVCGATNDAGRTAA